MKILKRTAKFENQDYSNTVRDLQNTKLNLPKKTKLFVDQTMRERENSISNLRTLFILFISVLLFKTVIKILQFFFSHASSFST